MEPARILVVEDEVLIAADLSARLKSMGYDVYNRATSAKAALELIEKDPPDLVLMDIVLKGEMDGIDAAAAIRERWGIPVVFLTAYAEKERLNKAKLSLPFGYILKPFQERDIQVTVEMALYLTQVDAKRRKAEENLRLHQVELEAQNEELRNMQAELQKAHNKYFALYDLAPVGYLTLDKNGVITEINLTAAVMFGTARPSLMNWRFSHFIASEYEDAFYRCQRKAIESQAKQTCELKLKKQNGACFYVQMEMSPDHDEEGNFIQFRTGIIDITARISAENELRKSEEKFRVLYDRAPLGYQSLDEKGYIIEVNQAWLNTLGYSRNEVIGKSFGDFLHPDWVDHFKENFPRFKAVGEILGVEFEMITRQGSPIIVSINGKIGLDKKGGFQQTHCILHDITEPKRAEEKIKFFAYSISHDLKNPSISIYGLAKRLYNKYSKILDEQGREYCNQILGASKQISDLIEKINIFISTKELPLTLEKIQLKEILQSVRDEHNSLLASRNIEWSEPEYSPSIVADRLSILRALKNLVDNALKYGGDSLSDINIRYQATDKFHIISVHDDGAGIETDDPPTMFKPFERNSSSRGVEGTGLGLAIVKEIAEQHRGEVWVNPGVDKGAVFFLSISKNL